MVENRLRAFLGDEAEVFGSIDASVTDVNECSELVTRAADFAKRWPGFAPTEKRDVLARLVTRIELKRETLEIRIAPRRLADVLDQEGEPMRLERTRPDGEPTMTLTVPARLKRAGMETRLLIEGAGGNARATPDRSLHRLLGQAHRFHEMVMHNRGKTISELAEEAGVGRSYFTRILRLSFLAPDVVKIILRDRHPIELTAKKLASDTRLPNAWPEQRAQLGTA